MSWGTLAGIGFGVADALGGGPKNYNPWEQADAAWRVNNPSRWTPFGSVEYTINPGELDTRRDDTFEVRQTLSPEMQALADRMLGMAGRGAQTFTSRGMGSRLNDYMTQVLGNISPAAFDRSEYGFGQTRDPAQPVVIEEEMTEGGAPANDSYAQLLAALGRSRDQYGSRVR